VIQEFVRAQMGVAAPAGAAPQGSLAELIGKVTGRVPKELSPDSSLGEDLRLSSVDRVELLAAIEDRYQVDLNETSFAKLGTVGELERMLREPVSAERRTEYTYPVWPQRWPMTWIRSLVSYALGYPAQLIMSWPRVVGRENLRGVERPVLVISNHITQNDIGFIKFALPPRLRHKLAVAMGGELLWQRKHPPAERGFIGELWDRITYWLLVALMAVFPLPQRSGFREAFAFAGESADRGFSIVVFPEGARTQDGEVHRFRSGIGMLVNRLNLPVVPMRIDGLFQLKQRKQYFSRPGTVTVHIGKPVRFDADADPEQIAQELENIVRSL
jgi:long-chain acyl-CoA synthetase